MMDLADAALKSEEEFKTERGSSVTSDKTEGSTPDASEKKRPAVRTSDLRSASLQEEEEASELKKPKVVLLAGLVSVACCCVVDEQRKKVKVFPVSLGAIVVERCGRRSCCFKEDNELIFLR